MTRETKYILIGLGLCGAASTGSGSLGALAGGTIVGAGLAIGEFATHLQPHFTHSICERFAKWLDRKGRRPSELATNHDLERLLATAVEKTLLDAVESFEGSKGGKRQIKEWASRAEDTVRRTEANDDDGLLVKRLPHFLWGAQVRALSPELWRALLSEGSVPGKSEEQAALTYAAEALCNRLPDFLIGTYRQALGDDPRAYAALQSLLLQGLSEQIHSIARDTLSLGGKQDQALAEIRTLHHALQAQYPDYDELRILGYTIDHRSREIDRQLKGIHRSVEETREELRRIEESMTRPMLPPHGKSAEDHWALAFESAWHLRMFVPQLPLPSATAHDVHSFMESMSCIRRACEVFLGHPDPAISLETAASDAESGKLFREGAVENNRTKFEQLHETALEVEGQLIRAMHGDAALWFNFGQCLGMLSALLVVPDSDRIQEGIDCAKSLLDRVGIPDYVCNDVQTFLRNIDGAGTEQESIESSSRAFFSVLLHLRSGSGSG